VVHITKTEGYTHNWNFSTEKKTLIIHKEFKKEDNPTSQLAQAG